MSEITNNKKGTMLERATTCFLYAILCIFPLVFVHYYADILYVKYYFYIGCTALLIASAVIYGILYFRRNGKEKYKVRTTAAEKLMLAFLLAATISTFQSDYFYESFWGNEGRLTGLFLILLYVACFFIIARFGSLKRRLLDAFLFVGNLVCLFGITDYFQMDILGFKENMVPEQLLMFTSTIGNINIYTVVVAMFTAIAMILFISEKKKCKKAYYYITLVICLAALITGQSDNAYVSLLALFGFSPLYLFQYRWGIKGYGICVATLLSLIFGIHAISEAIPSAIGLGGIIKPIASVKVLPIVVAAVWLCLAAALWFDRNNEKEEVSVWWRRGWIGLIIAVIAAVLYVLYDCNVAGNAEKYAPIQSYVLFNERWGTNRGYIWGASLECYQNFPWYRKLVGFGPDTFGILTYNKYRPEAFRLFGEIYDSPHNEYLQYLVTMGAAGLISYVAAVFATIKQVWQKQKENPMAIAVLFALICYWAQAVVNINIPISAALMWTLWGIAMASCREKQ
ncbi:MAG: O-antigen ligase family protein [Lachnospirales bacterium]